MNGNSNANDPKNQKVNKTQSVKRAYMSTQTDEIVSFKRNRKAQKLPYQLIFNLAQQIKNPIQLLVELLKNQINLYQNQFNLGD